MADEPTDSGENPNTGRPEVSFPVDLIRCIKRRGSMGFLVRVALCVLLAVASAAVEEAGAADAVVGVPLQGEDAVAFLTESEVVGEPEAFDDAAITGPVRVTLSDGSRTFRAVFKHEDTRYADFLFSDGREVFNARDSYRHEIAAYELDQLLGLDIVPPCVGRKIGSKMGSLCFWVEGSMTEAERRERGLQSSDPKGYKNQLREIELFQQFIADLDYSDLRNLVVDEKLRIHKVDSSMAFDTETELLTKLYSSKLSKRLIDGLEALDKKEMNQRLKPWLHKDQLGSLWDRRKRILKRADQLIDDYGEERTLY
jgi:hypothetical protein